MRVKINSDCHNITLLDCIPYIQLKEWITKRQLANSVLKLWSQAHPFLYTSLWRGFSETPYTRHDFPELQFAGCPSWWWGTGECMFAQSHGIMVHPLIDFLVWCWKRVQYARKIGVTQNEVLVSSRSTWFHRGGDSNWKYELQTAKQIQWSIWTEVCSHRSFYTGYNTSNLLHLFSVYLDAHFNQGGS